LGQQRIDGIVDCFFKSGTGSIESQHRPDLDRKFRSGKDAGRFQDENGCFAVFLGADPFRGDARVLTISHIERAGTVPNELTAPQPSTVIILLQVELDSARNSRSGFLVPKAGHSRHNVVDMYRRLVLDDCCQRRNHF